MTPLTLETGLIRVISAVDSQASARSIAQQAGACYVPDMTDTGPTRATLLAAEVRTAVVGPPPGYAVLGWALVFVTTLPLVLLPLLEPELRSPGYLAIAAASLGLPVWLIQAAFLRARIELTVAPAAGMLRLRAPLYLREVPLGSLAAVEVQDDAGPGVAFINWPVTGRARSRRGVRIDLGGTAALVLATHDGQRFTVVTPDAERATELRAMVVEAVRAHADV